MFTSIYRPKKIENFIGNKNIILPFIRWLLEWDGKDSKNKCALVSGLTGIGKDLLVELILKKHDYNIISIGLDDERDKDYIDNTILPLLNTKTTVDSQNNVLVVNDIDAGGDYGFISSLKNCIQKSNIPIICICNNRYDQSIKPILNYCFDVKLTKPSYQEVYKLLYDIVVNEKIKIKESELKDLYEQSSGDIRFILNNLQFGLRRGKKNVQSSNIFETTGKLMSIDETIESKYDIYWLSDNLHPLMVQENYINNTLSANNQAKKLDNLSYSVDALSDVDLFETNINMTNWELLPYVAINTINATSKCNKKAMIKFPQYLSKISQINQNKKNKLNVEVSKVLNEKEKMTKKMTSVIVDVKSEVQPKKRGRPKKNK